MHKHNNFLPPPRLTSWMASRLGFLVSLLGCCPGFPSPFPLSPSASASGGETAATDEKLLEVGGS
jgi:hypothetical protein